MNKKQTLKLWNAEKVLDWRMRQNRRRNEIKIGDNEGRDHALKKCEICIELVKAKKHFYTEAVFFNGLRADVFVLDDNVAIEVVGSETKDSLFKKSAGYPCRIVVVRVEDVFNLEAIE